jgi:vancomycin resistance protein VanW
MALLSERYPWIYTLRVQELRLERRLADRLSAARFAERQVSERLPVVVTRHSSLLRRHLGTTDPRLQETKIVNLRLAARTVDGLVIGPGETFSFWRRVGSPSARRGYQEGLVLFAGSVSSGTGGGLCQLANLLYWMVLHTPLEVIERHHHPFDAFPDDRRVLPFGTGASVFYNYVDLRVRNPGSQPFQLEVWLTDSDLRGRILTDVPLTAAYHVFEVGHRFEQAADGVVRCNEVWRREVDRSTGRVLAEEMLMRNRSRVGYAVDPGLLAEAAPSPDGPEVSASRVVPR